ncbi:MAG: hypothetical protein FWD13_06660, partial [Treponema sp.]|nr:hypothetical protein [Treponema sp.]
MKNKNIILFSFLLALIFTLTCTNAPQAPQREPPSTIAVDREISPPDEIALEELNTAMTRAKNAQEQAIEYNSPVFFPLDWQIITSYFIVTEQQLMTNTLRETQETTARYYAMAAALEALNIKTLVMYSSFVEEQEDQNVMWNTATRYALEIQEAVEVTTAFLAPIADDIEAETSAKLAAAIAIEEAAIEMALLGRQTGTPTIPEGTSTTTVQQPTQTTTSPTTTSEPTTIVTVTPTQQPTQTTTTPVQQPTQTTTTPTQQPIQGTTSPVTPTQQPTQTTTTPTQHQIQGTTPPVTPTQQPTQTTTSPTTTSEPTTIATVTPTQQPTQGTTPPVTPTQQPTQTTTTPVQQPTQGTTPQVTPVQQPTQTTTTPTQHQIQGTTPPVTPTQQPTQTTTSPTTTSEP